MQATGTHAIGLVIVDQASSNPYIASGFVTLPHKILDLGPARRNLATGEALELRITF